MCWLGLRKPPELSDEPKLREAAGAPSGVGQHDGAVVAGRVEAVLDVGLGVAQRQRVLLARRGGDGGDHELAEQEARRARVVGQVGGEAHHVGLVGGLTVGTPGGDGDALAPEVVAHQVLPLGAGHVVEAVVAERVLLVDLLHRRTAGVRVLLAPLHHEQQRRVVAASAGRPGR